MWYNMLPPTELLTNFIINFTVDIILRDIKFLRVLKDLNKRRELILHVLSVFDSV